MTLPAEMPLNDRDAIYLRRAIELSRVARERGNRPFGAVVVGANDDVLVEIWNSNGESGDCTAHAETNAVRQISPKLKRDDLASATLYSSGEPCVMCSGSIFLSNIRRVVFGIDAERLRVFRGVHGDQRDLELSCRDIFASSPHRIECIGPALVEEASSPHIGFWKS